ncbi:MAG: redoxin domain-containing protein [Armatimonadota bacterium]|nr:redoxin domain-containing protein [bacterium]MDW8321144.1 redoxin domain-containing protein [Armatimonadota bacterium]
MASSSQSGGEGEKTQQKVHPSWGVLVIVAAAAVIFVMVYPFIADRQHRNLQLPTSEETTVSVADRIARAPNAERAKLAQELFRNPNPLVRLATVEAIEDWKIEDAYSLLERGLEDNCSAVRRRSMEVLWKLDRKRGMRLLLAGLRDEDVDIRRAAVSQARFANDKRVVPAVIPLLDDHDRTTRFFALGVLRKLTGQPYFTRIADPPEKQQAVFQQWKAWWARERSRWADEQQWATAAPIHPKRVDPAPSFNLRSIDGARLRLEDLKGKILLLHFYGTWCAPCEAEMPGLMRLRQTYPESELAMIGVAVNETHGERAVREWIEKFKITYPQALATPQIVSAYWVQGVPITYLIDREGRIRYRFEGERDFETLRKAIERVRREASATGSLPIPAAAR